MSVAAHRFGGIEMLDTAVGTGFGFAAALDDRGVAAWVVELGTDELAEELAELAGLVRLAGPPASEVEDPFEQPATRPGSASRLSRTLPARNGTGSTLGPERARKIIRIACDHTLDIKSCRDRRGVRHRTATVRDAADGSSNPI
jgi:hypothetical protein